MKISMKSKSATMFVAAIGLSLTAQTSQAATAGSNAAAEVAFLKAIPTNATLSQIKKLLPQSTKFSAAKWNQMYGNYITVKGKVSGRLWFVPIRRPEGWGTRYSKDLSRPLGEKFLSSDGINRVELVMDNGSISSYTNAQTRINAVRKILGKPSEYKYLNATEAANADDTLPGWIAYWDLSNKKTIGYLNGYGNGGKKTPVLYLLLPDQWQGAG